MASYFLIGTLTRYASSAKYRNDKLTRLEELVKQRAAIEAKIETSVQKMEGAYDAMYYEFKKFLEEKIEMAEQADA